MNKKTNNQRCVQCCSKNAIKDYFPFCSERCQKIDLANWANETYTLPITEENNELLEDKESPYQEITQGHSGRHVSKHMNG